MPENVPVKFSILMPAHNEGRHIYQNIKETKSVLDSISPDHEIVVVDDGSEDNTLSEIKRAAAETERVRYLSHAGNRGKGWALKRAFSISSGELIFFLDSDLDIHPRQFRTLLQVHAETGADVVIGSKRHPQSTLFYPRSRRIISSAYFFLVTILFGLPLRDTQTGIKLFTREALRKIFPPILVKRYAFDLELLVNAHHQGFAIAEAPVVVQYRGKFGHIGVKTIRDILVDTLAIFYRLRFLRYYDRPLTASAAKPLVSILIPFSTPGTYLKECLARIAEMDYPNYEVILLPDGPMECEGEKITVLPTGPLAPPRKRDIGASRAKGEIIAFIDDDAYPDDDWLVNGVRRFADDSTAAVGGPASTPPTGGFWEQAAGRVLASWMVGGTHLYRYMPKMLKEVDDYPTSNLMVRKSVFESVGGFQTPYWPGEDTVLCLKITRQLGAKILYDPDVQVWHHRRTLFLPHWRQIGRYGTHRGYFAKRFPDTSLRLSYFLPSLWTIFLLLGWLPLMIFSGGLRLYLWGIALYMLATCLTAARSLNPKMAAAVALGIMGTHIVYGLNFIRGLFKRKLDEE